MSNRTEKWLYALPLLFALAALLPFLGKAFTIDDTLFLLQAQHALVDPLHPTAFDVVWDKNVWMRCSAIMPSGPMEAYLLTPAVALGGVEWAAHLTQLVVFCFGLIGVVRLARTFELSPKESALAAGLVVASPCVLGMASTVMPDVPAMSFGVWGLDYSIRWVAKRRLRDVVGAITFLAAAALSRPHAAAFLGVAFLAASTYDDTQTLRARLSWAWRDIWHLAVGVGFVVLYGFLFKDPVGSGGTLASSTNNLAGWTQPERHLVSFLAHWAFTTPVMFLFVIARPRLLDWRLVGFAALPLAALIVGLQYEEQAWIAIPSAIALAGLIVLLRTNPGLPVPRFLALASSLLLPLPLVIYVHLPAKYLVTSIPAATILIVAHLRSIVAPSRSFKLAVAGLLAGYAGVGLLVVDGDSRFAGLGRRAAAELITPQVKAGHTVWFAGHWGMQWYAMRAGGIPLTTDAAPRPRDYLLGASWQYDGGPVADKFPNRVTVERLNDTVHWGHVMKADLGAGFYSNWWGLLPWSYGKRPVEDFVLSQFLYGTADP